jgi:hypothetical protein
MTELKPVSNPMSSVASHGPDEVGEAIDQREYISMIGSLMYRTATRPDIQFVVGCARAFRLPHSLCIKWQFSGFSDILNTLLSLGFGILLLLHWILLDFLLLILRVVGLTEKTPLGLVIFLYLLLFAGLIGNSLQLHNPPPRPSM